MCFALCLILASCVFDRVKDNRRVFISNRSHINAYFFISENDSLYFFANQKDFSICEYNLIRPRETEELQEIPPNWEEYLENCSGNKMRIIVVLSDSVDKYGWRDVLKNNIHSKIYRYSLEELQEIDWKIEFNGK
ncbi:MAG: hypothetical protein PHV20_12250 [Bacteroidales bacterium]|nr:hypothetical protein [Bacteroidales bacterium]